jgi:hypothetical protein
MLKLFQGENMIGWRQDPAVVLSDGKATARITFLSPPGTRSASDIAVMGAELLSLKPDPENSNTWIAELRPEKGALRASLAAGIGDLLIVYPVTVAPPLEAGRGKPAIATEGDLRRHLSRPPVDLNNDGRRDRIDDFIAAANCFAAIRTVRAERTAP